MGWDGMGWDRIYKISNFFVVVKLYAAQEEKGWRHAGPSSIAIRIQSG